MRNGHNPTFFFIGTYTFEDTETLMEKTFESDSIEARNRAEAEKLLKPWKESVRPGPKWRVMKVEITRLGKAQ